MSSIFLIGLIIQYFLLFFLFRSLCSSAIHILHHDAFRWYSLPLRRAVLSKNRDNGSALPQRVHSLRSTPSTTTRLRGFLLTISHGPHSDAPYLLQYARECLPHLAKEVQSERGIVWWTFILFAFFYRFYCLEYLIHYLWNNRIAICLYRFLPPLWKGNTVQSGGNPIISATNRGLSWEVFPPFCEWCSPNITGRLHRASVLIFPFFLFNACGETEGW